MYMLANVIDAINQNTFVLVSANSKRKPKRPEPIMRPSVKQKQKAPGGGLFAQMARMAFNNSLGKKDTDGGTGRF